MATGDNGGYRSVFMVLEPIGEVGNELNKEKLRARLSHVVFEIAILYDIYT